MFCTNALLGESILCGWVCLFLSDIVKLLSSGLLDEFVSMVHGLAGEEFEVLGVYKNNLTPVEMRHSACNGRFSKCLSSGLSKRMCPYCSNREVLIGYNDLWTTNPRKAMMLKDDVLGCVMTGSEEDYVDVICPNCNRTLVKRMNKFSETYCPCPYCSSTYPFPERFMMSVLTQLVISLSARKLKKRPKHSKGTA